jgi:hypothetical protein
MSRRTDRLHDALRLRCCRIERGRLHFRQRVKFRRGGLVHGMARRMMATTK